MAALALDPSTIELINERMKRDGYSSPDALVREALASLKQPGMPNGRGVAKVSAEPESGTPSDIGEEIDLDLSYESVPLEHMSIADMTYTSAGALEMIPFDGDL